MPIATERPDLIASFEDPRVTRVATAPFDCGLKLGVAVELIEADGTKKRFVERSDGDLAWALGVLRKQVAETRIDNG